MVSKHTLLNHTITMDDLTAEEEFITAAEFEDATRTVVRTLGNNFDCDIVFAGNGGKTDGKTVMLPAQDPTKLMTKKQYAVGQGFANHETMHNLCTDIDHFTSTLKTFKSQGKKLAMSCAQAIEDVRIERAAATLYPGIPNQIASTADYAAKMFLDQYLANDPEIVKDFKRIGPLAITWRGRQRIGYESPYIQKALDHLSPEMLSQLDKWCDLIETIDTGASGAGDFDQGRSHKGSHDALRYAELLAKEIEDIEDDEEDDPNQQGNAGGKPGDGDGTGGGAGGAGGAHNSGQGDMSITQNAAAGGSHNSHHDPVDPDMHNAVAALLNQGNAQAGWRPVSTMLDTVITRDKNVNFRSRRRHTQLDDPANLPMYNKMVSEIGGKTAVMKRKFERALMTAAEADYVSGQRTGRLDVRRRGVHIMQGKENVFRKKQDGKAIDTAVTLLVDASGSMSGEAMYLASQVCVALAECLERTSVDLEILAFRADTPNGIVSDERIRLYNQIVHQIQQEIQINPQSAAGQRFHRAAPLMIFELKSFDDGLRESRVSLGAMPHLAGGTTPDGDAILHAAASLMRRKKNKRIMLVMTDGAPGYNCITGNCSDYTKKCIAYATKLGISMVGIGIGTDHVDHLYKNHAVVRDIGDLDKSVIDNVARLILGESFKVDNADVTGAAQNYKRGAA